MMETSTPISESPLNNTVQQSNASQELSEEDRLFHQSISPDLDKLEKKPATSTVKAILEYSKSL